MAARREDDGRRTARRRNLQRVLRPRHVAVIGGAAAAQAVRQLDAIGYAGAIWPVNPRRADMLGHPCSRLDRRAAAGAGRGRGRGAGRRPAGRVRRARRAAAAAAASSVAALALAEDGVDALERELLEAAGDCALVGPNCHGILNYLDRAALWPDDHGGEPVDEGFALISQSGNVALNATFQQRSAPLGYVISTGNQAQLEIGDFIDALVDDPRVHAIGLFIEGLRDVAGFARAARRALEAGIPVVALKVGVSAAGARATLSHTAALAGSDAVYDALFERLGVRRAGTLAELLETLKLLAVSGPLGGRRMVSLSCSGGEAALMGDRLAAAGIECPEPSAETAERVAATFGIPRASVGDAAVDSDAIAGATPGPAPRRFEPARRRRRLRRLALLVLDFPPPGHARPDNWRAAMDGLLAAHARAGARRGAGDAARGAARVGRAATASPPA
ncbi:MAG: hypothetical protein U5K43_06110 [Halofilum sp. (in: g-proteobacteria)]|nr:hypothetical protein [Halofilum sp. (in: g-proteobacteria)]